MSGTNGARKPLYEIETDAPLPAIRIDGVDYALRLNVDYGEMTRLRQKARRILDLTSDERTELTEQEEAELADLLHTSTRRMLDAPGEILDKLTDLQLQGITNAYYTEAVDIMDPTGALRGRSSQDSTGSTEAT